MGLIPPLKFQPLAYGLLYNFSCIIISCCIIDDFRLLIDKFQPLAYGLLPYLARQTGERMAFQPLAYGLLSTTTSTDDASLEQLSLSRTLTAMV